MIDEAIDDEFQVNEHSFNPAEYAAQQVGAVGWGWGPWGLWGWGCLGFLSVREAGSSHRAEGWKGEGWCSKLGVDCGGGGEGTPPESLTCISLALPPQSHPKQAKRAAAAAAAAGAAKPQRVGSKG